MDVTKARALKDCRGAFKSKKNAILAFHLHHGSLVERITPKIDERISYILQYKGVKERVRRFQLMRPVRLPVALAREYEQAFEEYDNRSFGDLQAIRNLDKVINRIYREARKLHATQCRSDCPWTGRTIFPRGDRSPLPLKPPARKRAVK